MTRVVNVQDIIDSRKVRLLHVAILILCAIIMLVDGYDLFMVGAIAPVVAADFHKPASAMVTVFFFQQVGIAFGSVIMGPISDRFGRKYVLITCAGMFGALMLSCVAAQTLLQLAILRGLCGVFLSGVFPVATTLASEFLPTRLRARSLSLLIAGYVAGASGGGAVAAFLIGDYGWRGGFWLGGLLPLACVPIFLLALPESVQFRARRNPRDPMIARTLMRLAPGERFDGSDTFIAEAKEPSSAKPDLLRVLKEGRVIPTFLLWGAFFLAMGNGALVSSWLPTFFKVLDGISVQRFGHVLILGSIAAVGGTLLIGILLDRMRPTTVMMLCYLLDAAALFCVGLLSFGGPPFLFAFFVMYACMFAGTAGLMTISTSFYPPAIRATGFGWTIAAGRFGSIAGPLMGGAVLTAGLSLQQTVSLIAIPPLGVVLLLFLFRRFTVATQNSRIAG